MIRFAAMVGAMATDKTALARYEAGAGGDLDAARGVLAGQRPKRLAGLDTILTWAARVAGVPDFLLAASLAVSGDRAETAALLLPAPVGPAPALAEVLARLQAATPITAHATLLDLWARLPVQANFVVNRLASGTFRSQARAEVVGERRVVNAVMVLVQPSGPEVTLALWRDGVPVPIARLPLTLPETPEVMAWVRANTVEKFGPVRKVPPVQVFVVEYGGVTENRRRKSGVELHGARVVAWLRDGVAGDVTEVAR